MRISDITKHFRIIVKLRNKLGAKVKEEFQNYRYHFFTCLRTLEGHLSKINSICFSSDNLTLYSGSEDNNINAWDWQAGKYAYICKPLPQQYAPGISCLQLSPDGQEIVIAYRGESIETRSLLNARRIIVQNSGLYHSFAISRDGKTLFNGNANFKINIWDMQTATITRTLSGHSFLVTALCLSRDGNILFSGSGDYTIKIWDWHQGELKSTLKGHSYGVNSIVLSPDGLTLFSASNDKTIKIWNWQTGELINTLEGHLDNVSSIAVSPDGDYLFSASHDNTVKVWGLE